MPLETDNEEGKVEDWEMITYDFSGSQDDFDVLCHMVSVFPFEYDVVTEVTDAEGIFCKKYELTQASFLSCEERQLCQIVECRL